MDFIQQANFVQEYSMDSQDIMDVENVSPFYDPFELNEITDLQDLDLAEPSVVCGYEAARRLDAQGYEDGLSSSLENNRDGFASEYDTRTAHSKVDEHSRKTDVLTLGEFHCNICKQSFTQRKSLLRHQRTIHQTADYRCSICRASFSRKDHRDRHVRAGHKTSKMKCMVCGQKVSACYIAGHWKPNVSKAMQGRSGGKTTKVSTGISRTRGVDTSGRFGVASVA